MTSTTVTFDIIGRDRSGSAAFDKVASSANRADGAMSKFSAGAMKVVKAGALASVAAGGFAVKLGIDAVGAASDLNETLSKSQVIFGKHADGMESWAAQADMSMGLSQQAALNAAAGFGDMFSQIGFSGDQAAKMSRDVVQLSADLGSFNNLETADVAERMSAAFRGEFDSLQALVPNINAARVESEALAMTGKKTADELTAQEKAAATLAIVTKDGARAQGDFARTSDGLANQTKILKAQLDNASASFGQKLLPMVVDLAQFANRELVPAIEKGADWIGDRLPGAIDTAVDAGKDLAKAVAPAVEEVVEALRNLSGEGDKAEAAFDLFVDAVRVGSEVIGGIVDFIDELPGPVKDIGVQAAFAAYGLSKMNTAMVAVRDSQFVTNMMDAERRTAGLASAARTAAGVGGILALTSALGDASDEGASFGDILKGAAGGAGIGAMFGPVGALIGAGAGGGLTALRGAFAETTEEARENRLELARTEGMESAREGAAKLEDALVGVVHAYGDVTRAAVEASFMGDDGKLAKDVQILRDMGVSMGTIIDASLGQGDAISVVEGAFADYRSQLQGTADDAETYYNSIKDGIQTVQGASGTMNLTVPNEQVKQAKDAWLDAEAALEGLNDQQGVFDSRISGNTQELRDHRAEMAQLADQLGITVKQYKNLPRRVRTRFEGDGLEQTAAGALRLIRQYKGLQRFDRIKAVISAPGVDLTRKQVVALQKRYDLTPKQLRTLLRLEGIPAAEKQVRGLQGDLDATDKKRPKPKVDIIADGFNNKRAAMTRELGELDRAKAKPTADLDLGPYYSARSTLISSLNAIPDETVVINVERRGDRGHAKGTPSAPAGWAWVGEEGPELVKFRGGEQVLPHARSVSFASANMRATPAVAAATAMTRMGGTVKHVIEVRVVGGELDLTRAKAQIDGIAREVARDEIRDDREFLRTQSRG